MGQKKYNIPEGLLKMIHQTTKMCQLGTSMKEIIEGEKAKYEIGIDYKIIRRKYRKWLKNRTFREKLLWEKSFWWKVIKYIITFGFNYEGIPLMYPKRRFKKWLNAHHSRTIRKKKSLDKK